MTPTLLEREAESQTYVDVERMLYRICGRFKTQFGGDLKEYLGVANDAYLRAYLHYDSSRSAFSTFCWKCVWRALLDCSRKERNRSAAVTYDSDLSDEAADTGFDLMVFLRELSDDANLVVHLVLESPKELGQMGIDSLRRVLRRKGWEANRIEGTFSEIRQSL
jgi:DNA-directed RNA polymerase specialized sigma24 family protein